ncbi:acetyl-CoA acetyltransferase [Sphingomonas immobilis]|uniref:Acetyl-CoA acetyltransferase n=1 Tax=Sphingomonas immobilis TaxID=3063997 RepID=A0ABT8ZW10_9SPHN|nr:acetyl-CoA acetyltransferase [Sphingomonas sp. CA1-15]MDO7841756.1 acetyl-CoA acetyltransferase [Sphingomonas sp. CA1-15]
MRNDPERIPVIVGVGQVNDRPADPQSGLDSAGLMEAALRAAEEDAGGTWLADLDSLAVVDQISFRALNPIAPGLAERIGAHSAICEQTKMASGDSPILLLNQAANRIGTGELKIAAVAGGEALRTAAQRAAAAQGTDVSAQNASRAMSSRGKPSFRSRYGLVAPVDVYPLYENAGRAAYGQTLAVAQHESGEIWSRFSEVADANPGAWIHKPASVATIVEPTADNRPIAFPYTKFMVANSSVNQGAGFIVTSLAEARRRGVPDAQLIYVGMGAAAHEPDDPLGRDRYDRSPSMAVSIRRTLDLNKMRAADLDLVELYSCFPCVPKMARRVLDWPIEKPATVFGGLTFGGGPIGNYMSHAVVSMVLKLRESGRYGLLFANGGFATHNHTIVIGREPIAAAAFPNDFHFQAEADADRSAVPQIVEAYEGAATIETYTVLYQRDGSVKWGVIVARTPDGGRTLAKLPASDIAGIAFLTDGQVEPVGSTGVIVIDESGDQIWGVSL